MQFANPLFLFGICAIAIPILIHLFNFRRYKTAYFSNVKLLQEILLKTKRESKIQHLIVLFLRIFGIIALAFAFAQPFFPNKKFDTNSGTIVTLFVDNSFSMEAQTQQTSLLNEALDVAKKIVDAFSYHDEFVLITNDFSAQEAQIITKDESLSRLDLLDITPKSKTLEQLLHFNQNVTAKSHKAQKIAYFISDFQKSQYDFSSLQKDTTQLAFLIPIENKGMNNISIDSCWFTVPVFQVGYNVGVTVRISNYGKEEVVKLPVKLYVNHEQRALGAVDIIPNSYTDFTLNYTIQQAGIQEGMVEIYDTPITFDDRFYFVYEVAPTASVIAIQAQNKNRYLHALYGADSLFHYESMNVNQINYNAFSSAQLIILDQLESLSSGLAAELEKYVQNGGTLTVFPAEKMNLPGWNTFLNLLNLPNYQELQSSEIKVGSLNRESIYFKGALQKKESENWEMPTVSHYYSFENKNVSAEPILRLENNAPMLTAYNFGKGRVILSAVALNDFYGNAHKNAIFFIPLHNLGLMGQLKHPLFNFIGRDETVIIPQKAIGAEDVFVLKSKTGNMEFIPEQRNMGNETQMFLHSQIQQAGFYEVMKGGTFCTTLAFNYPRNESNLDFYSENELEKIADHSEGRIQLLSSHTKDLTRSISDNLSGTSLWRYFVVFALLCFFSEVLLLRFWGKAKYRTSHPKTLSLLFLFCFLFPAFQPVSAQIKQNKQSKPEKQLETVYDERKQSVSFADGLREFYSQNYSAATQKFQEVLAQNPKNHAAFYLLHKVAVEQNDFLLALHYLKEASKMDKKNEWYQIDLANVYEKLGDFANAVKIWEEICKVKYQNEYYLMSLANNYLQLEKWQDVIKVYDRIEGILGKNDDLTETKKNIWLYLNDVKNAVREYEKMLEIYPYEIGYYITAGEIYLSNNMPDKALPFFQKAMQIDADNAALNLVLANYYEIVKKPAESFNALFKAFSCKELEIEEKLPALKKYLTGTFRFPNSEMFEKTEQLAQTIAETHPYDLEGWATLAKLNSLKNKYKEAKSFYEKCIALDESQYSIWEDYFFVLSKLEDYQTIVENEKLVEEYFPTHATIQYGMALALYKEKYFENALKAAKQALSFTFENNFVAELNLLLGDISFEMGQKEEAVKYWKIAQRRGINTPELQEKITANQ